MESYQQLHPHYNMRPPPPPPPQAPPSMAVDPHFPHHNQPPPPPPPANWYPGQFQYHPSHSPSPPPQQNQWGPPPPPPPPYSGHPHQPYPAQPYPPPPPPPRPSQAPPLPPPPYQQHQDWTNANWSQHAGWEYPAHGNEEDWEAKARAWASARSAMDNQHPQAQFTPVVRQEEPAHYANQYAPPVESHYQDVQQTSFPSSGYMSYQGPSAPLNRPPMVHQQEPASVSSYGPDAHLSYTTKDGVHGGEMNAGFPHHQGPTSSFVHQQEVPSSYSSVPGKEDGSQGQQHGHHLHPADGRSAPMDHTQFAYGNHAMDPMDQPLSFAARFNHENDSKMHSGYPDSSGPVRGTDSFTAVSSMHAWPAPVAPGVSSYPPITPVFPSASQHDPSIGVPPLPGQPAHMFGRGPSFQPAVPSINSSVGLGAGSSLHSTAAFPIDAYGAPLSSERPKKAAVPNWLREEIIKNKATITSSAPEPFKEESQSNEDEIIDKPTAKGDQADSKSMDSARSTEEEDEDYDEVQKTAAINQEIKRVLTEVLLKVTDELFDEIATKVLSEDDLTADAMAKPENHVPILKTSPPRPAVPALKASAKVLVPVKAKAPEGHVSGESSSGTPGAGNVLGLANYSSDDEDEIQTSSMSKSDKVAGENGHRQPEIEDNRKHVVNAEGDHSNGNHDSPASKLNDHRISKNLDKEVQQSSSRSSASLGKKGDGADDEQPIVKSGAKLTDSGRKATVSKLDVVTEKEYLGKSGKDDTQDRDTKRRDRHESKRGSSGKDREAEIGKERESEEETRGRRDQKRQKKDKEDYNISKERSKDKDDKHAEKTRDSDSRRRSPHLEDKDGKKERERDKKRSGKDDVDRKRERTKDEKGDKSRHKSSSDASRHKRRRSSSIGRGRKKNEESVVVSDGSDDEASDDSKRKVHSKRRNLSPSPVRSKRRQVSRSPHSKHSQRRHSPYPSLDDSRGRRSRSRSKSRSRSRSPVRRRR